MPPPNGTVSVTNGTQYGGEIYFECDTGFRLDGNASSVCQLSGQWEPETPICQLIGNLCFSQKAAIYVWIKNVIIYLHDCFHNIVVRISRHLASDFYRL